MENWQSTPYLIIYVAAGAIISFLTIAAWKLKSTRATRYYRLSMLAVAIWIVGYAIQISITSLDFKLLVLRFEYAGIISAIYFWLIFVIYYTQYQKLMNVWVIIVMAIIPVISFAEIITLQSHDMFYKSYQIETIGGLQLLTKEYGIGFYVWAGYAYFISAVSLFIVASKAKSMPRRYRNQIVPLAISVFLLILPNIFYILKINPIYPFDFTSLFFAIIGVIMLYSLHSQNFLDIIPVAYNLVIKDSHLGIIIVNSQHSILDINPAATQIFNLPDSRCIGKNVTSVLPEFDSFEFENTNENEFTTELELGEYNRTYEIKITSFHVQGDDSGRIVILWDISEFKTLLNDLDAYAHTVAHDLKSPISQMIGLANMLKLTTSQSERDEMTRYIESAAKKMSSIIDELLTLAKIRHIESYKPSEIKMDKIVENAILRIEDSIADKTPQINYPKYWPNITGNAIWFEEIWYNLISNAFKYGGDTIELGWRNDDICLCFWVKDNGVGISANKQDQLFSKFVRIENYENLTQGHGLGLSIVQRIVEKIGGKIWVESELGHGTSFHFTIPVKK